MLSQAHDQQLGLGRQHPLQRLHTLGRQLQLRAARDIRRQHQPRLRTHFGEVNFEKTLQAIGCGFDRCFYRSVTNDLQPERNSRL